MHPFPPSTLSSSTSLILGVFQPLEATSNQFQMTERKVDDVYRIYRHLLTKTRVKTLQSLQTATQTFCVMACGHQLPSVPPSHSLPPSATLASLAPNPFCFVLIEKTLIYGDSYGLWSYTKGDVHCCILLDHDPSSTDIRLVRCQLEGSDVAYHISGHGIRKPANTVFLLQKIFLGRLYTSQPNASSNPEFYSKENTLNCSKALRRVLFMATTYHPTFHKRNDHHHQQQETMQGHEKRLPRSWSETRKTLRSHLSLNKSHNQCVRQMVTQ